MEFIDTDESLGFMFGEVEAIKRTNDECKQLESTGWTKTPDWFPVPTPGHEYRFPGNFYSYMKPKPRLRHWLRYRFIGWWRKRILDKRFYKLMEKDW